MKPALKIDKILLTNLNRCPTNQGQELQSKQHYSLLLIVAAMNVILAAVAQI